MTDPTAVYRDKSSSLASKSTLACAHLGILAVVVWLLFGGGIAVLDGLTGASPRLAPPARRWALVLAASLYFARTLVTTFVFMKRRMPTSEVAMIAVWILVIDGLFAYVGGRNAEAPGREDAAAAALLLAGSAIHTGSELQRHLWKRRPENAGHVYTGGLFGLARHVNYFGDEVLFTGWALLTGSPWLLSIPAIMVFGFLFANIPAQERYLEERYGEEYRRYAQRVKRFIPFVL